MKRLFLDDCRQPIDCSHYMYLFGTDCTIYHKEWDIVKNYDEFINYIKENGLPDIIIFNHDLADIVPSDSDFKIVVCNWNEKTGLDCTKWLIDYCMDNDLDLPEYIVHSMNPSGCENIISLLKNFKKFQENE